MSTLPYFTPRKPTYPPVVFLIALLLSSSAGAQTPNAAQIMKRVAENQDHAIVLRSKYIYNQKVRIRALRNNGKLAREEETTYTVTPSGQGSKKQLVALHGRFAQKGKLKSYEGESDAPVHGIGSVVDEALVRSLRDGLVNNEHTKDGIATDLFPLTSQQISKYHFTLLGKEQHAGRSVFHIAFEPKPNNDEEKAAWKGEALIDSDEYQPVSVWTQLAAHILIVVKVVFGTNLQQLGFSLTYRQVAENVWFPATYGGEFRLRAAFFYGRTLALSLENTNFKHTSVDCNLILGKEQTPP